MHDNVSGFMTTYQDRARGMLVGLAVGDALGAPYEFGYFSNDIESLGDKIAHYQETDGLKKGAWTDDTSMALCIADSLLEKGGYDSYDMMDKFEKWYLDGYRSSLGFSIGIGRQISQSLNLYNIYKVLPKNLEKTEDAGNGPIMRLAPIVIANTFPNKKLSESIKNTELKPLSDIAILSCRETHNSIAAECVTVMFATTLYAAIRGHDKASIQNYAQKYSQPENPSYERFWLDNVEPIIDSIFEDGEDLRDLGGYIVDAYIIALWGFVHSESFEDGMLKVLRHGGDTDTNAAIYGQLAGAYYGYKAIPKEWREEVCLADELVDLADKLLAMKKCPILRTRFEDDEHFEELKAGDLAKCTEYYARSSEARSISDYIKELKAEYKE